MEHPTYLGSMYEYTITDKGVMENTIQKNIEKIIKDKNAKWYRQGIRDEHPKVYNSMRKLED